MIISVIYTFSNYYVRYSLHYRLWYCKRIFLVRIVYAQSLAPSLFPHHYHLTSVPEFCVGAEKKVYCWCMCKHFHCINHNVDNKSIVIQIHNRRYLMECYNNQELERDRERGYGFSSSCFLPVLTD